MKSKSERKMDVEKYYEMLQPVMPKYCPNCAEELDHLKDGKFYIMPYGNAGTKPDELRLQGFDCYCDSCEWSGNIEPDALDDFVLNKEK